MRDAPTPLRVAPTLATYLALTFLAVAPFVVLLSPYGLSLATGAILAVVCYPLYAGLRRRLPRFVAALGVTLGMVGLVLVPVGALGVGAFRQGAQAIGELSTDNTPTLVGVVTRARDWIPFLDQLGTPEELLLQLKTGLVTASSGLTGFVFAQIRSVPQVVLQLVLVALSLYFSLVDGRRLYTWIGGRLPLSAQIRTQLAVSFRSATNAVILASVAAAGAQAFVVGMGFWLLGVPSALLAAGLTFVLGWVPALPMLVWGGGALYLYVHGSWPKALGMVAVGVVVGIIDNVVRPLVLRGQEAMHPMVSLVAVLGGIAWFGVPGVFLGPLLACMAIALLDLWPAVASYCGIAVSASGDTVPDVPMLRTVRP